ncbi:MAG: YegS/Rv2252/BmrU family lipid kinase [Oscillospiraceae bacterium]|nr:YegS/Rv2252/BmrU family lipid kinase [Oscillospiraceae bacterium]
MRKMLFIFNPNSGKGMVKAHLPVIIDTFVKGGYEVVAHPTQTRADALHKVTARGADFDVIACAGGDGTLNEVIAGLMQLNVKLPLGYIPAGTMNDFASSLEIPKTMTEAAKLIVEGETAEVDIGSFNGDYFTYVAGFGAFTSVSYETPQQLKNMFGSLAYVMEMVKSLGMPKSYRVNVSYDGKELLGDYVFGMASNSKSVGGIKGLGGKDVFLDDGLFECLLIKNPETIVEFQMTVNALLRREMESEHFHFFKASKIEFHSDDDLPWTLDGEFGGNCRNVTVTNMHKAVSVFVKKA